jgi:cytochrome b6-f complex iron-sulfur subunit
MSEQHGVDVTRRRFLHIVAGGVGGVAAVGCMSSGVGPEPVGDVPAGNVAILPVGSVRPLAAVPACVGRDANGVYAMTLTCTHAGCDMGQQGSVSGMGLFCACHGSRFDTNGNVVAGPAPQPLEHFAVTVDARGDLTVHGGQIVAPDQRLKV